MEYFGGRRYPGKTNAGERPFMFRDATAQSILIAKSCISNPCDRCLCDDPCLSKFGAPSRKLSARVFKRGKDTEPKTTIARKKYGILLQRMDCARCILKQRGFSPALLFSVCSSHCAKISCGRVMPLSCGYDSSALSFANSSPLTFSN